jgi:hypothetical protein
MFMSPNAKFARLGIGAKAYLEADLLPLLMTGKASDSKLYRERIRKNPMQSADMWTGTAGDLGFDYQIIDKRVIELKRHPLSKNYDLFWENNVQDTKVGYRENPNGRFIITNIEKFAKEANQWVFGATVWNEKKQTFENQRMPINMTKTTAGADPFGLGSAAPGTKGGLKRSQYSDGGGAVYWHDTEGGKDIKEWESHIFVCRYQCRTNVYDYYEDMLKMSVFFNAMMAFERNKEGLWGHFVDRGYGGFLKFQQRPDGSYENKPGFYAGAKNKENLFIEMINQVAMRGHMERILEVLIDCREIRGYDDLTNKDAFAACGWALLGAKSNYGKTQETMNNLAFNWDLLYEPPYTY